MMALATVLLFAGLLSGVAVGVVGVLVYRGYANDLRPIEEAIASQSIGQSVAYDRNGQKLGEYVDPYGRLRDPVPLTEISPYLIAATVATEDASFYENPGVNFRGLGRAAMENLTPFGPGFFEGSGGSSITQQLVKNVYLTPEEARQRGVDGVERKIKETVIALELKQEYDDNQILEWYLNHISYGGIVWGAEEAAQTYFGKNAKDLTLAEAALLAGVPQSPTYYNPGGADGDPNTVDPRDNAKARQLQVLELMEEALQADHGDQEPGGRFASVDGVDSRTDRGGQARGADLRGQRVRHPGPALLLLHRGRGDEDVPGRPVRGAWRALLRRGCAWRRPADHYDPGPGL